MNTQIANLTAFTFFSANLSKLLPQIPLSDHPAYFNGAGRYHKIAHNRRNDEYVLKSLRGMKPINGTRKEPGVIATFHIGAYKLLPIWLVSRGIPITLLVSADIAAKESEMYRAMGVRFAAEGQSPLEILEAEDPMVIRKMIRSIGRGNWVLVFLDGNEGTVTKKSAAGRADLVINFLAHKLRVKTGVAELAFLAGCPIYPLALLFDERLNPKPVRLLPMDFSERPRQEGVREITEVLYGWLAAMIRQFPTQWEGWFYIHHDLLHQNAPDHHVLLQQFLPFAVHGHPFLLHRETYGAYPVSDQTFQKLCDFYEKHVLENN